LKNIMPDFLADVPLIIHEELHLTHDGAPAHFSPIARRYLNRKFPGQWIGRGGPISWPPCSPDLNPLNFYLWGHLKSPVYVSSGWYGNSLKTNCGRFPDNTQHSRYFGIFRWQWDVELRPVFRQEVDIRNIYCKVM
jgi:hypothetical protein